jgi:LysR family glycine cleavage system transcriptional activator
MVTPLPPLNGLRAFEAAARHLSFTLAARELNVTQTAISHQIRRLEERLGLKLFQREHQRLILTPAAQAYLPAVRRAFSELREATDRLQRQERRGPLTVSTLTSFAVKWLVPRLASFQAAHPDIEVRVTTGLALVDFRRDDVDMAIRYGHGDWPGLHTDWLLREEVFPVCAPSLAAGPTALRRPADLAQHRLLHVTAYAEDWRLWLTAAGIGDIDPTHGLSFDLQVSAIQAAIDGLGVALGRRPVVDDDLAAGRLVAPFDVVLPSHAAYYVVSPIETAQQHKVKAFREWLLAEVAGNVPAGA